MVTWITLIFPRSAHKFLRLKGNMKALAVYIRRQKVSTLKILTGGLH